MRFALVATVLSCTATTALACIPPPGAIYDKLDSSDSVIGVAEVTSVTITPMEKEGACLSVSYSPVETTWGEFPNRVIVKQCPDDISTEAMKVFPLDEFGFVLGATVIVGLVKQKSKEAVFKYAIPSCWGPLLLRLDTLSDKLRSDIIGQFRKFDRQ